jgi:Fic family protein
MSYAILREAMNTGGLWSVARGLARRDQAYKAYLAACDEPRHGDYDGRGSLSEMRLAEFAVFFLETCIDQVDFMESLIQPERLRHRILIWTEEEMRLGTLPARADAVLDALLYRGELPRADVVKVLGTGERQARRITAALLDAGVLTSASSRAPLHLAFPARLAGRWLPGLFPDR